MAPSIIPRGMMLGATMHLPEKDSYVFGKRKALAEISTLMGGRVAEELCFEEISTGAQNDLERATQVARAMVAEYGMSEKIGPLSFGGGGFRSSEGGAMFPGEGPQLSGATAQIVDEEVARLVNFAHERAKKILSERRPMLDRLSELLMTSEVIEGEDLLAYFEGRRPVPGAGEAAMMAQARADALLAPDIAPASEVPPPPVPPPPPPGNGGQRRR